MGGASEGALVKALGSITRLGLGAAAEAGREPGALAWLGAGGASEAAWVKAVGSITGLGAGAAATAGREPTSLAGLGVGGASEGALVKALGSITGLGLGAAAEAGREPGGTCRAWSWHGAGFWAGRSAGSQRDRRCRAETTPEGFVFLLLCIRELG